MKRVFVKTILSAVFSVFLFSVSAQNLDWVKELSGGGGVFQPHMIADTMDNIYVTAPFFNSVDVDPGPGVITFAASTSAGMNAFVCKYDSVGALSWAFHIDTPEDEQPMGITIDDSGYVYVAMHIQTSGYGVEVIKFSNNGSVVWDKLMAGAAQPSSITVDAAGNVYTAGYYTNTTDFDPGPSTYNLYSQNNVYACFISKLNGNGNFVWAKQIGGAGIYSNDTRPTVIQISKNGKSFFLAGAFGSTNGTDFDPGPGVFVMTNGDYFVCKFDTSGQFNWAKQFIQTYNGPTFMEGFAEDNAGNIYCSGNFGGTIDFDPGPGTYTVNIGSAEEGFLCKLDSIGNFNWVARFQGAGRFNCLQLNEFGGVYVGGFYHGVMDFDPGPGLALDSSVGSPVIPSAAFLVKLDSSGNYNWHRQMKGGYQTAVEWTRLAVNKSQIYMAGQFNGTIDFDPDSGITTLVGSPNIETYILNLEEGLCSNFILTVDSAKNLECDTAGYVAVHAINGSGGWNFTWNSTELLNDSTLIPSTGGIYQVTATAANGCSRTTAVLIKGAAAPSGFDINPQLVTGPFRPGFSVDMSLYVTNYACTPQSGNVKVGFDSLVTFVNSTPSPVAINGDTIVWSFNNIDADSSLVVHINAITSMNAQIGNQVCFELISVPFIGDLETSNNNKSYCFDIVNGYDPNDKKVYPIGQCSKGYVANNQLLTYTIRFQNTGNSEAINIHIFDSLDAGLDLSSMEVVATSHPLITEILPGNVANFNFQDIHLIDSTTNEPLSHGFVVFEIKPLPGLPAGTELLNKAEIYFDFNPPVITNSVLNTITYGTFNSASALTVNACNYFQLNGQTFTSSGNYTQIIGNAIGCDSVISLNLTITPVDTTVSLLNETITANDSTASYLWYDCNTLQIIPGETAQSFTAVSNGTYGVYLTKNGCTTTSECQSIVSTGIAEMHYDYLITPNPSAGVFRIKTATIEPVIVVVKNILGNILHSSMMSNNLIIDISGQAKGVYFIQLTSKGKTVTKKVVVE